MSGIEVKGLTKRYGDEIVVDDVSFTVPRGVVTGFVGANGSGKTTTMRMMAELCPADSGRTNFDGTPYGELVKPRRHVGVVVDRIGAHPGHSARTHLDLIARGAGLERSAVAAVLAEVGLDEVADRQLRRYSLGMTQRCALAAALLGDPWALILDEPAIGLDPAGIRWLRAKIRSWADAGRSVFVSTHQLAELAMVVDRVVVIDRGRTRFVGARHDLAGPGSSLEEAVFELLADTDDVEVSP